VTREGKHSQKYSHSPYGDLYTHYTKLGFRLSIGKLGFRLSTGKLGFRLSIGKLGFRLSIGKLGFRLYIVPLETFTLTTYCSRVQGLVFRI
jgi:hypothetical protein